MKQAELTQRTRSNMASSLKKLMAEKSVRKITVREIIEDCGINRQTFYYHFRDVYDLLNWMFEQEARNLIQQSDSCESWEQRMLLFLKYIEQNAEICTSALDGLGRDMLYRFLRVDTESMLQKMIEELSAGMNVSERYRSFLVEFYIEAFSGVVVNWLRQGRPESVDELMSDLEITIQGNILRALRRADAEGK